MGGRFVTFSGSTSWVLPRGVGFFVFVRIDEVSCTDPLPLYAEFFRSHAIGRSSWLYGGVVYSDEFCIWLFDDLCRMMVRSIVCILPYVPKM